MCDRTCKNRFLCGFQHYTFDDFDHCVADYISAAPAPVSTFATTILTAGLALATAM